MGFGFARVRIKGIRISEGLSSMASPYAGGVQVGLPEPPFKTNDIHSMHVVEVLVYTHLLALIHINYETEIDIDNVCKMVLQKHPRRMENSSLLFL